MLEELPITKYYYEYRFVFKNNQEAMQVGRNLHTVLRKREDYKNNLIVLNVIDNVVTVKVDENVREKIVIAHSGTGPGILFLGEKSYYA